MVRSRNQDTAEVIADPRWQVEAYMGHWVETLGVCWYQAMAVNGPSSYLYDRQRVRHDTCVGARRRRRCVLDRNRALLSAGALASDMPFDGCEKEVSYCQKSREVIENFGVGEIPTKMDLELWYFERPYTKLPLSQGG